MPNDNTFALFAALSTALKEARSFEDAATATLKAMLDCASHALAASPIPKKSDLLRAMIHLRPEDAYQRLFGIEHPSCAEIEASGYLTSTTVWRWITQHRCAVSIDVQFGDVDESLTALLDQPDEPS